MRSEWREVKLKDVLLEKGYIRGPFGSALRRGELLNSGPIPVYEQMHAIDGIRDFRYYIDDAKYESLKRFTVRSGDLIVSCSGTVGCISTIKPDDPIGIVSQALLILRADPRIILPEYLRYYLTSPEGQHAIISRSSGSVQVNIARKAVIIAIDFLLPPLEIQKAIVDTLSCLDAKIEMNNKINENLEAQAQAIFKSWFVDFEPFQDGEFVESELGLIPEGWHVKSLSEIVASTIAGDWGKAEPEGNHAAKVYCIRGADIPDVQLGNKGRMPTRYILPKNIESKRLQSGNLVVEISGGSPTQSTGRVVKISDYLLGRYDADMICTNFCRALSVEPHHSTFLYHYWLHLYDLGIMFGYENGTTGIKNFDLPSFLKNMLIALPPNEILEEYNEAMDVFESRVYSNGLESEVLSTLRDTLLPKLMSGEIEVPID